MADDFSEIEELASDLGSVPAAAEKNIVSALRVTAHNLKDDWRQGAERTGLQGYAASIDYDLHRGFYEFSADIGPNLGKNQGALGLVEDGGDDVHSAPQHAGRDALEANEPDFYRGLEIAITQAVVDKVEG